MRWLIIAAVLLGPLLTACDTQVPQTVVVRASVANPRPDSLWLVESDQCTSDRIKADRYRNGLWIFKLSSTRGGVGAVTQELALCYQGADAAPIKAWHSLHGGGAPLIVLSCDDGASNACALYMEQHTEGSWGETPSQ
jgi:hypothetical protein